MKSGLDGQLGIRDPNGPSALLAGPASMAAPAPAVVVLALKPTDAPLFPHVLSTAVGTVVDGQSSRPADRNAPRPSGR
ncbi:hypothetical protein [Actinacidiphila guanduensis]|uniref:Uncharacterized protein n=1 Tax=Actinacidiphila guanduensis TaxID=310781 RepID=A0A1H0P941_9ACTN|nr:hypothetical protein [Actinacidiphila guanduensis]SDP01156.1 hypothetical protein SAMN05216259_115102 [Actinacidiphila guanduensis]